MQRDSKGQERNKTKDMALLVEVVERLKDNLKRNSLWFCRTALLFVIFGFVDIEIKDKKSN